MVTLPVGLQGVALAQNLGPLGVATLAHPQALAAFLPLVEPCGVCQPKEALADVYRVTDAYVELKSQQPRQAGIGLRSPWDRIRKFWEINKRASLTNEEAVAFLRELADGFRALPTAEHGRDARELLANHPEWITRQMRDDDPRVQAAFRFRDAQLGKEIERATALLNAGTPVSLLVTLGGGGVLFGGTLMDDFKLIFGGTAMILAALVFMIYVGLDTGRRQLENGRLWRELHDGAEYPQKVYGESLGLPV